MQTVNSHVSHMHFSGLAYSCKVKMGTVACVKYIIAIGVASVLSMDRV